MYDNVLVPPEGDETSAGGREAATEVAAAMSSPPQSAPASAVAHIPVALCERHVHLTREMMEQLFFDEHWASGQPQQPHGAAPAAPVVGDWVTLVGPGGRLAHVRVAGPPRAECQVELSHSDARRLGIDAPPRESGNLKDTPGVFVEGPRACIRLDHGVIRTLRHIHLDPDAAGRLGLRDGDRIDVAPGQDPRRTLFCDVLIRVSPAFQPQLHLDVDEGLAAGLRTGSLVTLRPAVTRTVQPPV